MKLEENSPEWLSIAEKHLGFRPRQEEPLGEVLRASVFGSARTLRIVSDLLLEQMKRTTSKEQMESLDALSLRVQALVDEANQDFLKLFGSPQPEQKNPIQG